MGTEYWLDNVGTYVDLLSQATEHYLSKTAIEDGEHRLSYGELNEAVFKASKAFIHRGVKKGDPVAIWAPNIWEWVVTALGAQTIGAILVPINTRFKGGEAAYILDKAKVKHVFGVQGFLGNNYLQMLAQHYGDGDLVRGEAKIEERFDSIVSLRGDAPTYATSFDDFIEKGALVSHEVVHAARQSVTRDTISDLLFTSGTTGYPKGVMTSHQQNLKAFTCWSEVVGLTEGDRYLVINPFFHAFGYKAGWLASLMRGATILPHPVFDPKQALERIGKDQVSMLPGPPALFQTFLAQPNLADYDLSSLRLSVTGAASIPVELIQQMKDVLNFDVVVTGYGLTEACGIATMCRAGDPAETIANTSGRAIPGCEVLVVDEKGKEVPRGEPGEVVVRGYNVMQGYFEMPDETAKTIDAEGWLHTGDIGVMDEEGNLRITDRLKDMFIMGGFNCYPAEIENCILKHGDLMQVAVIGVPDERMGEVGMAWVVRKPGADIDEETLSQWCRDNMANYKVPRDIRFVDSLPMNATGKVQKFRLREQATVG
ncbi:MAG: FadD3 family acyl-CoA ligase [Myxococcota bacterium]|nr:FadD3 family acyl-CoA ligase [Myxococcota bacterium]